ncbi:MAG: histidinol dehydrogenase [Oscillospiraceae bacterium]|nr:histidinol dehydrogenase [Oscillospiraceae bacterium]
MSGEPVIRIRRYDELDPKELTKPRGSHADVSSAVTEILQTVRREGDRALYAYTERFDRVKLDRLEVSREEREAGLRETEPAFMEILKQAAQNIRRYHEQQRRQNYLITGQNGVVMGKIFRPIQKVGMYVPNGTAAYPSTVLMDLIPARIAGCEEIVMVTPPGPDGRVNPAILAAAEVCGIDRIFKVGGAQAIAALAYGTESIPAVYKIIGPGNAYVAEAKKQVHGTVSTDTVAGPSEVLILADGDNSPRILAADMLAQAEHDPDASAMLVTGSETLAEAVAAELSRQLGELPRKEIAEASLKHNGMIILTDGSMDTALEIANLIAPEHLEICTDEPMQYLPKVRNAGSIFLGRFSPEPLGDYMAGPNHTLPTGGSAKFSSPLSVDDFVTASQFTCYTEEALRGIAPSIVRFAEKEDLIGHARSILSRFEEGQPL